MICRKCKEEIAPEEATATGRSQRGEALEFHARCVPAGRSFRETTNLDDKPGNRTGIERRARELREQTEQ